MTIQATVRHPLTLPDTIERYSCDAMDCQSDFVQVDEYIPVENVRSSKEDEDRAIDERVKQLSDKILSGNRRARSKAMEELSSLGPKATPAIPALLRVIARHAPPDYGLSETSDVFGVIVFSAIGPAAVPALLSAIKDGRPAIRRAATHVLTIKFGRHVVEEIFGIEWYYKFCGSSDILPEILHNRLKPIEKSDRRPVAVVIFPKADYNDAFKKHALTERSLKKAGYKVVYYEVETEKEAKRALSEATADGKRPADIIVLGGHGDKDSLHLGDYDPEKRDEIRYWEKVEEVKQEEYFIDTSDGEDDIDLSKYVARNGHVILRSCSTGKGTDLAITNLANHISRFLTSDITVYAPDNVSSGSTIRRRGSKIIVSYQNASTYTVNGAKDNDESVSKLISVLNDGKSNVDRFIAAQLIGENGVCTQAVESALLLALDDNAPLVRVSAAGALGASGCNSEPVIEALIARSQDKSSSVRTSAVRSLGAIKCNTEPAIEALVARLQDEDNWTRFYANNAIVAIGPAALPALISALSTTPSPSCDTIIKTLGNMGRAAEKAVPLLIEKLKDNNASTRCEAAQTIGKIGFVDETVISALVEALMEERYSDYSELVTYVNALGSMGPKAKSAIPALVELFEKGYNSFDEYVVEALVQIDPKLEIVVPALLDAFEDGDTDTRYAIALAFRDLGPKAKAAKPALLEALKDDARSVRAGAEWALDAIDSDIKGESTLTQHH